MGIIVKRSVRVKVIVTEQFKVRRSAEIRAAVGKLEAVGKSIDVQIARASVRPESAGAILERLRAEQRRNEQARSALLGELERTSSLGISSEYDRGALEGTVEVNVGDDFSRLGACEIVVKDDKIVEIRDGTWPETHETSL